MWNAIAEFRTYQVAAQATNSIPSGTAAGIPKPKPKPNKGKSHAETREEVLRQNIALPVFEEVSSFNRYLIQLVAVERMSFRTLVYKPFKELCQLPNPHYAIPCIVTVQQRMAQ